MRLLSGGALAAALPHIGPESPQRRPTCQQHKKSLNRTPLNLLSAGGTHGQALAGMDRASGATLTAAEDRTETSARRKRSRCCQEACMGLLPEKLGNYQI